MWDHVRGNDTDRTALMGGLTDRPSTGRGDYLEQVGRFYDHYLKGKGTAPSGFLVQDNTGSWRAQSTWPDQASIRTVPLRPGTYRYTGLEVATKVKAKGQVARHPDRWCGRGSQRRPAHRRQPCQWRGPCCRRSRRPSASAAHRGSR